MNTMTYFNKDFISPRQRLSEHGQVRIPTPLMVVGTLVIWWGVCDLVYSYLTPTHTSPFMELIRWIL
jgi:hypothetical protein